MSALGRIGSYLNLSSIGINPQDSRYAKFGKVAAGVGVAGLAVISWKFVAAGALAYSAYKGGRFLQTRYFQRQAVRQGGGDAVVAENPLNEPVNAGHDADGDQQERQPRFDVIADLRRRQAEMVNPHARRAFEAIITHPDVLEKGGNIQWLGKMIRIHGKWSKRTGGASLHLVKAFRKMKACIPREP